MTAVEAEKIDSPINASFWYGLAFFFWVIVGLFWLFQYCFEWLHDERQLPIERVVVEGDIDYLRKSDVEDALVSLTNKSFFSFDVNVARKEVEALPWVDRASIRKQWPNVLKIYITEQMPVAQWNGYALLNKRSEVFFAKPTELKEVLVSLKAPEGDEKSALDTYYQLRPVVKAYGNEIKEMVLSQRHALEINLTDGMKLNLGLKRNEWAERSQRFFKYYPAIAKQYPLAYVDLRYDTGFAVGLKNNN